MKQHQCASRTCSKPGTYQVGLIHLCLFHLRMSQITITNSKGNSK